jgi:hypothetical protein
MTSEERSCLGKIRYGSQRKACAALNGSRRNFGALAGELQVYLCRFCKGWHIGHVKLHPEPMRRLPRSK